MELKKVNVTLIERRVAAPEFRINTGIYQPMPNIEGGIVLFVKEAKIS